MEFFEVKTDDVEERTKKKFIESYQKQLKLCKILLASIFGGIGVFFLSFGMILLVSSTDLEGVIALTSIGVVFLGLAILFFLIFSFIKPEKSYERMKKMGSKYGVMNIYALSSMIMIQKEQIMELEARIEELEAEQEILRKRLNK